MAHSAALHGQPGRLQPALGALSFQQRRLAAPAGRAAGRMRHSRRLMVAVAEAPGPAQPSEMPKAVPPLDQTSMSTLLHSASETATNAWSSLLEKLAASGKGGSAARPWPALGASLWPVPCSRAQPQLRLLAYTLLLPCSCRHRAQAYGKSAQVAVQALLAGPDSWVSKEDWET